MSTSTSRSEEEDWIKIDLHIHTLHDAVFDRKEVFADAAAMGILLIPAVEVRLLGADVIVLNVTAEEIAQVRNFDDVRRLRARRGNSILTVAPHPFYIF